MARRIRARLVLQLSEAGLSGRRIAATQGVSRNRAGEVLAAAVFCQLDLSKISTGI